MEGRVCSHPAKPRRRGVLRRLPKSLCLTQDDTDGGKLGNVLLLKAQAWEPPLARPTRICPREWLPHRVHTPTPMAHRPAGISSAVGLPLADLADGQGRSKWRAWSFLPTLLTNPAELCLPKAQRSVDSLSREERDGTRGRKPFLAAPSHAPHHAAGKSRLRATKYLVWWKMSPLWQGGWNQMIFKVPSNPNHSVILWLYKCTEGRWEADGGGGCFSMESGCLTRGNLAEDLNIQAEASPGRLPKAG